MTNATRDKEIKVGRKLFDFRGWPSCKGLNVTGFLIDYNIEGLTL